MTSGTRRRALTAAVTIGPLTSYEQLLRTELVRVGYAPFTVNETVLAMARLSTWMQQANVPAAGLTPRLVDQFLAARRGRCRVEQAACRRVGRGAADRRPQRRRSQCRRSRWRRAPARGGRWRSRCHRRRCGPACGVRLGGGPSGGSLRWWKAEPGHGRLAVPGVRADARMWPGNGQESVQEGRIRRESRRRRSLPHWSPTSGWCGWRKRPGGFWRWRTGTTRSRG